MKTKKTAKLQYDAQGFPHNGSCRLTLCCQAAATCDEHGITYCKGCYKEVDPAYGDVIATKPTQKMSHPVRLEVKQLPEYAPDSVYDLIIKKGMKFTLLEDSESTKAKRGDVVTVSSVSSVFKGVKSDGSYSDYELLRVSNGKYSWRTDRAYLLPLNTKISTINDLAACASPKQPKQQQSRIVYHVHFWTDPMQIARYFGFKGKLRQEDYQKLIHVKEVDADLIYDFEEGVQIEKIQTSAVDKLVKLLKPLRHIRKHIQINIQEIAKDGNSYHIPTGKELKAATKILLDAGFKPAPMFKGDKTTFTVA